MLDPQHILVTGASSGIGAALAELYAAPGIHLSLHGRDPKRLSEIVQKVRARGATVTITLGDVTEAEAMDAWISSCDHEQPIDLVIANAGISPGRKTGQESMEQARTVFATNLIGVVNTLQPAIPLMQKRRRGQIAIMASLAGFYGFSGAASYCASKAAVRVYGEALRGDLSKDGIDVNVICPGFIKTPLTDNNPFPMPFLLSPQRAAEKIRHGLTHNQARIAFPWPTYALARIAAALPQDWISLFARHLRGNKPSKR